MKYINTFIKSMNLIYESNLPTLRSMETMAKRLKTLREKKRLTQRELAKCIGVSPSTYRDWEYGNQIKGEPYEKLAKELGVSLSYLLTGKKSQVDEIFQKLRDIERMVEIITEVAASL